ncbi:MAG: FtsX-like permease family protein, partial [Phycisphaerae bacterium]
VGQLGLLRCIGMTRWQLAKLIVYEVVPLGACGILCGIPIGLALTYFTMLLVPDYFGEFVVNFRGIAMAAIGGFVTTLVAAFIPAVAATTVTPLEASRPRARSSGKRGVIIAFGLALLLLTAQIWVIESRAHRSVMFTQWASFSIVLLYLFYALLAPLFIWLVSRPVVHFVATALGLRAKMLHDQVGHALWRSAGICCGLMVGLSLIVALTVFSNSFRAGWQFPKKFPEAYMWSFQQIDNEKLREVEQIRGISEYTVANARNAITVEMPTIGPQLVRSITWFLGCDPDSFLNLVQLEFKEGDRAEAIEKLKQGGHVLVAADFARTRNKHLNDRVKVWIGTVMREFTVAGVVDSPALDVASSYFQAQSEMRVVAVGSVIGTNDDLKKLWGIDAFNMVLLNFDLQTVPVPENWPPPENSTEGRKLPFWVYDRSDSVASRWKSYRERVVLDEIKAKLDTSAAFVGTVSELKEKIDENLSRITLLLSAVPGVALIVAALGVANLMTANITSRAKQIAMMRAVGATRGQILRLIIGEALVLGVLGCLLGLALGLHLSWNTKTMTQRMWGFDIGVMIPWLEVGAAVFLTVGLCLVAGLLPARHASRANVIDALHVP